MKIIFDRLSNIDHSDIIALNTNKRVLQQMPLAEGTVFDEKACIEWVKTKEQQWLDYGFGPWAFVVDDKFAGWGGLQYEDGDADLALVLHPTYWGIGKKIVKEIIRRAFFELNLASITLLLPPSRTKLKGLYRLGFQEDGFAIIQKTKFFRFRLYKTNVIKT